MAVIVGGLRRRLIRDSLYNMVQHALAQLGWFDSGRAHAPINMRSLEVPADEEIPLNTLALADEDMGPGWDQELGSNLAEHRWTFYLDFYAENHVIGKHLIYDVRDILDGRMARINRGAPILQVFDYTQATPTPIFVCQIERVAVDRAHDFPKAFQKHWYACRFELVDVYADDAFTPTGLFPSSAFYPSPSEYPSP